MSAERSLHAGDTVFLQGAPATALYRVRTGRVRLVRHLPDGSSVIVHVARSGATFAEAALFSDTYHCDAVAESAAVVAVIPKSDLLAALRKNPAACLELAKELAAQVRELRAHLEIRNIRSASARLLAWCRLVAKGEPPVLELDRPWAAVAAEIGLAQETLYRTLRELERAGQIAREGRRVVITPRQTRG